MLHKSLKTQKGFSLVELMVVVAIIGILAAIAVPQMTKFQAKARQSEAKTQLTALFTAEKGFFQEYSAYHSAFQAVGFSPEGSVRYNIGFGAATGNADTTYGYNAPTYSATGYNYSAADSTTAGGSGNGTGGYCTGGSCTVLKGSDGNFPPALSTAFDINAAANQFVAGATAVVFGTTADVWTINHNKSLTNTTNGIQ